MKHTSARPADRIEEMVYKYGDILFRICLITLGNASDAEDAVQETMIKYLQKAPEFENEEHEKAWLITVVVNKCRDILRYRKRYATVNIEEIKEYAKTDEDSGILDALMKVPEKYRIVMVLYYIEEYSTKEIAQMIGKTISAVKMRLQKGRTLLREIYRKEYM